MRLAQYQLYLACSISIAWPALVLYTMLYSNRIATSFLFSIPISMQLESFLDQRISYDYSNEQFVLEIFFQLVYIFYPSLYSEYYLRFFLCRAACIGTALPCPAHLFFCALNLHILLCFHIICNLCCILLPWRKFENCYQGRWNCGSSIWLL